MNAKYKIFLKNLLYVDNKHKIDVQKAHNVNVAYMQNQTDGFFGIHYAS